MNAPAGVAADVATWGPVGVEVLERMIIRLRSLGDGGPPTGPPPDDPRERLPQAS